MAKPTPKKTTILESLRSRLSNIDGDDPYHFDPTVMDLSETEGDIADHQYPAILITEPNEVFYHFSQTDNVISVGKDDNNMDQDGWYPLVTAVFKKNNQDDTLYQDFNKMEWDILYSIMQDINLGGDCDMIFPTYRKKYNDFDNTIAYLDIVFVVQYDFRPQDQII